MLRVKTKEKAMAVQSHRKAINDCIELERELGKLQSMKE